MDQLVNVLLATDKTIRTLQRIPDSRQGEGGLNKIIGPTVPFPFVRLSVYYLHYLFEPYGTLYK